MWQFGLGFADNSSRVGRYLARVFFGAVIGATVDVRAEGGAEMLAQGAVPHDGIR